MSSHDVLTKARHLLSGKKKWCSGVIAQFVDATKNVPCDPQYLYATQWCAMGALRKYDWHDETSAMETLRKVCHEKHGYSIMSANDLLGWEVILDCLDAAIVVALQNETPVLGHHSE